MSESATRMWPTPNVPNGDRKPKGGRMSITGMTPEGKKRQVGLENAVEMYIGSNPSISSALVSHANPSAWPVSSWLKPTTDGSGPRSPVLFASYDHGSWSSKTSQGSLFEDSTTFSATWPKQGMTRNGRAFALPMSAPRTDASASGSSGIEWPTPTEAYAGLSLTDAVTVGNSSTPRMYPTPNARDGKGSDLSSRHGGASLPHFLTTGQRTHTGRTGSETSDQKATSWPTPQAYAAPEGQGKPTWTPLDTAVRGEDGPAVQEKHKRGGNLLASSVALNPAWVSCLMGYPPDWCDIGDVPLQRSATRSSRKSQKPSRDV